MASPASVRHYHVRLIEIIIISRQLVQTYFSIQYILKSNSIADNAFKSAPMAGKIQYTTPSIMELHGLPYEAFNSMSVFSYYLSLMDYDEEL